MPTRARLRSDKPDLRVSLKLTELTDVMRNVEFKVFRAAAELPNGRVEALRIPGGVRSRARRSTTHTAFRHDLRSQGLAKSGERRQKATTKVCNRRSSSS